MFSAFSWGDFVQTTLIVLSCYYAAIGMIFYRSELRAFRLRFTRAAVNDSNNDFPKTKGFFPKENVDKQEAVEPVQERLEPSVEAKSSLDLSKVYVELEDVITTAKAKNFSRVELLKCLATVIGKYKNSIDKNVEATISAHAQSQLIIYSFAPLTDEEQEWLWLN